MVTLTSLVEKVSRGQISRSQVRREHGREVYNAVQAELRRREEERIARPVEIVEEEPVAEVHWCPDCCDTSRGPVQVENDGDLCERCRDRAERRAWMESTEDAVAAVATQHDWTMECRSVAETGSRYYELTRGEEIVTLRISDHGDCYCTSDYSLAMRPSGDDTMIEVVTRRLSR